MRRNGTRTWFLAAGAVALLGSVLLWRHQPTEYLRHVSPSLPDGTRYTFLYPSRINHVIMHGKLLIQLDDGTQESSAWLQFLTTGNFAPTVRYPTSKITALVNPTSATSWRKLDQKGVRFGSQDHNILIFDARSAHAFQLNLRLPVPITPQLAREDEVIARSFRILRPGENAE